MCTCANPGPDGGSAHRRAQAYHGSDNGACGSSNCGSNRGSKTHYRPHDSRF